MEIVKIKENQVVNLQAKAFLDKMFTGVVTKISDAPVFKQGDVLYTVRIKLAMDEIPHLKWRMTVAVEFE